MLKYVDTKVVFQEIPDEITLAISISNCPCHCVNCHSPYLAEDIGEILDWKSLNHLIKSNTGITCVAFMGGDSDPMRVNIVAGQIKETYPMLKVAWYSGRQELSKDIELRNFDYIKLGPYIEERGPLSSRTTNQRSYIVKPFEDIVLGDYCLIDVTDKFWK